MTNPDLADLQRWSEEVARDPASLAFLPLARAYRRQGQREAALRLCLRALDQHPTHVEGHALLALLYLEAGDRQKACDEWSIVLRLDPGNFEAHRGMGFYHLERGELDAARRHLERAAEERPGDSAVRGALSLARERLGESIAGATARDPGRVFAPLLAEESFLGAIVLDAQGLVVAGTMALGAADWTEALSAVLGETIEEAARMSEHLALGPWRGMLLETSGATIHLAPLGEGLVMLVAAARQAPTGWVLHTAARAAALARNYLERIS